MRAFLVLAWFTAAAIGVGLGELLLQDLAGTGGTCRKAILFAQASLRGPDNITTDIASFDAGKNAERNLQRWVNRQMWRELLPQPYSFKLNLQVGTDIAERSHAVLLPHEVFHTLYHHAPEVFTKIMRGGSMESLLNFWKEASEIGDEWYRQHPVIQKVADPRLMIPFGFHGDDAGVQGQEQVLVITWGGVAAKLATLDTRIVYTMLKVASIVPYDTLQTVYQVLTWSLNALSCGKFPENDHLGNPITSDSDPKRFAMAGQDLAEGCVGVFSEMRGDWKFLKESLYLQQHYGLNNLICHRCAVLKFTNDIGMRFTNFKRDAPHRLMCYTHAAWMAMMLAAAIVSPLLYICGFHISRVIFDILHCMELGIYQVAVPSAMKEMTQKNDIWPGATRKARFIGAFKAYSVWRKQRRVKAYTSKPFSAKVWTKHKYPKISQLTMKGAALRSMVYWMSETCKVNSVDDHSKLRAFMFESFVKADKICRSAGRHMTKRDHKLFCLHLEHALVSYNALAVEASANKKTLWKLLPKFHAVTHYYDTRVNPRRVSCYQDEDMVGKVKKIYCACHGSTAPFRGLQRYAILQCLRWRALLLQVRGAAPQ